MDNSILRQPTRWGFSLSDIDLPVFYRDSSSFSVLFTASTNEVEKRLPYPWMKPVEAEKGRALLAITPSECFTTDIGHHNELSIAFIIDIEYGEYLHAPFPSDMDTINLFIQHLPVTTGAAMIGGIERYGCPKSLLDIVFVRGRGHVECRVSDITGEILSLTAPEIDTAQGGVTPYRTFSIHNNGLYIGYVYARKNKFAESAETGNVSLSIGNNHFICDELKSLGLSGDAHLYHYIPSMESLLTVPRKFESG